MLKSKTLSSTCVQEFLSKRIISIPDNLLESHWHSIINPAQLESIVVILEMVSIICSLRKTPHLSCNYCRNYHGLQLLVWMCCSPSIILNCLLIGCYSHGKHLNAYPVTVFLYKSFHYFKWKGDAIKRVCM